MIFESVMLILTAFFMLLWYYQTIVLIIYAIPKSIVLVLKKTHSIKILRYFFAVALTWFVIPILLFVVTGYIFPDFSISLSTSWWFMWGQIAGGVLLLISPFMKSTRENLREEFNRVASKYKI